MRVGTAVRLHSLVGRPSLNGCIGVIGKTVDATTGRYGVRVDGESTMLALRPANLVNVAAEAMHAVLDNVDLLRLILVHIPRWARAGIVSGVSSMLRKCVWADPDLYRSVVVVAAVEKIPRGIAPRGSTRLVSRGFHRAKKYGARHFMEEGALPLLPAQLKAIPDASWVKSLCVEPCTPKNGNDALVIRSQVSSVLERDWPSVETLLVTGIDLYCNDRMGINLGREAAASLSEADARARAHECRDWMRRHVQRSVLHLHLCDDVHVETGKDREVVYMVDPITQPGLVSMQLDKAFMDNGDWDLQSLISGWTPEVRAKLRNLNLSYDWSHNDILYAMTHLPELRRLSLMIGGPDEDDFAALARAAASSKLEALYLNIDSSDLGSDALDVFGSVKTLKELVVVCDSCSWIDAESDCECDEQHVTRSLSSYLIEHAPGHKSPFALLVCDECAFEDHILDPLHRVFLPTTEEDWHLDPNAAGLEALPMLGYEEVEKIGIVRKAMEHLRMNMTEEQMIELGRSLP